MMLTCGVFNPIKQNRFWWSFQCFVQFCGLQQILSYICTHKCCWSSINPSMMLRGPSVNLCNAAARWPCLSSLLLILCMAANQLIEQRSALLGVDVPTAKVYLWGWRPCNIFNICIWVIQTIQNHQLAFVATRIKVRLSSVVSCPVRYRILVEMPERGRTKPR